MRGVAGVQAEVTPLPALAWLSVVPEQLSGDECGGETL